MFFVVIAVFLVQFFDPTELSRQLEAPPPHWALPAPGSPLSVHQGAEQHQLAEGRSLNAWLLPHLVEKSNFGLNT